MRVSLRFLPLLLSLIFSVAPPGAGIPGEAALQEAQGHAQRRAFTLMLAGQISTVQPGTEIYRAGQQLAPAKGMLVQRSDEIRTDAGGLARITFTDGSVLTLANSSSAVVESHVGAAHHTALLLAYGKVRAEVPRLIKPATTFQIRTGHGICDALGTDFEAETTGEFTQAEVHDGQVNLVSARTGESLVLYRGQIAHVLASGGIVKGPNPLSRIGTKPSHP